MIKGPLDKGKEPNARINWFRNTLGLAQINANQGKDNCAYCALRLDDYIREGHTEAKIVPVPTNNAGLTFIDTTVSEENTTSIIRSLADDPRVLDRCLRPVTRDTKVTYDLTDDKVTGPRLDLTYDFQTSQKQTVQLTRIDTAVEDLNERLKLLPRREPDGACFGLMVLAYKKDIRHSHIINYFVDGDDEVYFIDAQNNTIVTSLDMKRYATDVFFIPSVPKEGYKIKEERALNAIVIKKESVSEEETQEQSESDKQTKNKLSVIKALAQQLLLERVVVEDHKVTLILKEAFNDPAHYQAINRALYRLHGSSTAFQENFKMPKVCKGKPCLILQEGHGYKDNQAVLEALISFAASKTKAEKLNAKEALSQGKLLERVALDDNQVTLILKDEFNDPAHYPAINKALYHLHSSSPAFQEKFKKPKQGKGAPCLILREGHGYEDNQAVLKALISFAATKSRVKPQVKVKAKPQKDKARKEHQEELTVDTNEADLTSQEFLPAFRQHFAKSANDVVVASGSRIVTAKKPR